MTKCFVFSSEKEPRILVRLALDSLILMQTIVYRTTVHNRTFLKDNSDKFIRVQVLATMKNKEDLPSTAYGSSF